MDKIMQFVQSHYEKGNCIWNKSMILAWTKQESAVNLAKSIVELERIWTELLDQNQIMTDYDRLCV